jgi:hypothetical protein
MRDGETSFRVSLAHAVFGKNHSASKSNGDRPRPGDPMTMLGDHFLREMVALFFSISAGLTLSGIIANIYRILARKPESRGETALYYGVMVLAGASVLLENATRSYRKKDCSAPAYGFAVALVGYWSFIMGVGILTVVLSV